MKPARLPFLLAIAAAAMITVPYAAPLAQSAAQQVEQVSDKELQSYAGATAEVQRIGQKWQSQIDQTQNVDDKLAMRQQAEAEMVEAIRAKDLTVTQYNQIYRLAQVDPDVRARVDRYMQKSN